MAEDPLSKRGKEDARQTKLIRKVWEQNGKAYGYRKLHDDLLDQGERCCPNRAARLARQTGIKARIGYQRRLGSYGGKPSDIGYDRQHTGCQTAPTSARMKALRTSPW